MVWGMGLSNRDTAPPRRLFQLCAVTLLLLAGAGDPPPTLGIPVPNKAWVPDYAAEDRLYRKRWGLEPMWDAARHEDAVRVMVTTNESLRHFAIVFSRPRGGPAQVRFVSLISPDRQANAPIPERVWDAVRDGWQGKRQAFLERRAWKWRENMGCIAVWSADIDVAEAGRVTRAGSTACEPEFPFVQRLITLAVDALPACRSLPPVGPDEAVRRGAYCEQHLRPHR